MYRDTVRKKDTNPLFDVVGGFDAESTSKINNICDAFLRALQDRANPNLLNIITAHVCKSPPDLDGGLLIISKLTGMVNDSQKCRII
jgi:elongator complex protein 1